MKNKKNKGFTLVELIVVLVILAILAAILVPALLGYIDNARGKQTLLNARSCMIATQAELSSMYAKKLDYTSNTTGLAKGSTSAHYNNLKATADFDNLSPACTKFIFGCEAAYDGDETNKDTIHKMYTVNYIFYQDANGDMVEFYNGEWGVVTTPSVTSDTVTVLAPAAAPAP